MKNLVSTNSLVNMMKKLTIRTFCASATLSMALLTSTSAFAASHFVKPSTEKNLVKICQAIQSDSHVKYNRALKRAGLRNRDVANGVVCNGLSAIDFAVVNGSDRTARTLALAGGEVSEGLVAKR